MSLAFVIVLGLAAHRLWRGFALDDAPWLETARDWIVGAHTIVVFDIPGKPQQTATHYRRPALRKMIECPWCLGSYVSAGLVVLWWEWPHAALWPTTALAVADVVGLVHRNFDPSED